MSQTDRLKNEPILLIRIGSDSRPATAADITDMEEKINKLLEKDEPLVLITHHWVAPPTTGAELLEPIMDMFKVMTAEAAKEDSQDANLRAITELFKAKP